MQVSGIHLKYQYVEHPDFYKLDDRVCRTQIKFLWKWAKTQAESLKTKAEFL
jgi:hypothetical protein